MTNFDVLSEGLFNDIVHVAFKGDDDMTQVEFQEHITPVSFLNVELGNAKLLESPILNYTHSLQQVQYVCIISLRIHV